MPNDMLEMWMSEQSAHDAAIRGWSRSPKGRSQGLSAKVAALAEQPQFSQVKPAASLGMGILQQTWLHHLMKRAESSCREKGLAETQTVWNNHT